MEIDYSNTKDAIAPFIRSPVQQQANKDIRVNAVASEIYIYNLYIIFHNIRILYRLVIRYQVTDYHQVMQTESFVLRHQCKRLILLLVLANIWENPLYV